MLRSWGDHFLIVLQNGWLAHRLTLAGHRLAAADWLDDADDGLGAANHYPAEFTRAQADFDEPPFAAGPFDLVVFNLDIGANAVFGRLQVLSQQHEDAEEDRFERHGHGEQAKGEGVERFRARYRARVQHHVGRNPHEEDRGVDEQEGHTAAEPGDEVCQPLNPGELFGCWTADSRAPAEQRRVGADRFGGGERGLGGGGERRPFIGVGFHPAHDGERGERGGSAVFGSSAESDRDSISAWVMLDDPLARFDPAHAEGHTHHLSAAARWMGDAKIALGPQPARKWAGLGAAGAAGNVLAMIGWRRPERALRVTAREALPSLGVGAAMGALAMLFSFEKFAQFAGKK